MLIAVPARAGALLHGASRGSRFRHPFALAVVHRHRFVNFSRSRRATGSGTIDETSPPNREISRMYFDAIAELADADGMKSVCTPDTFKLACACAISLSKSTTA